MRKSFAASVCLALAILTVVCGCTNAPANAPTYSISPAHTAGTAADGAHDTVLPDLPTVSATPLPTQADKAITAAKDGFFSALRAELVLINCYSMSVGYDSTADTVKAIQRYILKEKLLEQQMMAAVLVAKNAAKSVLTERDSIVSVEVDAKFDFPTWQYLATVLPCIAAYDNSERENALFGIIGVDFELIGTAESAYVLRISNNVKNLYGFITDYAKKVDTTQDNTYIDLRFTYAYLAAVYDKDGNEAMSSECVLPEGYLETLVFPLDISSGKPDFNDTWGAGRSENTRKHMGVDIKAPEGTPILSCCDGVVTSIGTADIPGNYVTVKDALGYEYHYYHLVEPTTHVKVGDTVIKGQVIGNVGNTGNSETNHLHLTLINPEGVFVDPFTLLNAI